MFKRGDPISSLEKILIEISPPRATGFKIISWHRPPNDPVDTFDKFELILCFRGSEGKEVILVGDTNSNLLVHSNVALAPLSGDTKHTKDLYQVFNLMQLISEPIRIAEHTTMIIDHSAVNDMQNISIWCLKDCY